MANCDLVLQPVHLHIASPVPRVSPRTLSWVRLGLGRGFPIASSACLAKAQTKARKALHPKARRWIFQNSMEFWKKMGFWMDILRKFTGFRNFAGNFDQNPEVQRWIIEILTWVFSEFEANRHEYWAMVYKTIASITSDPGICQYYLVGDSNPSQKCSSSQPIIPFVWLKNNIWVWVKIRIPPHRP